MLSALLLATVVRPNIIYVMADDLGYREVGFMGQKKIPTPNLDRLAKEGIVMTRAYAGSPVCAPTRYSLLTGKHQGHAAIRGNKEQGGSGPNDKEGQLRYKLVKPCFQKFLQGRDTGRGSSASGHSAGRTRAKVRSTTGLNPSTAISANGGLTATILSTSGETAILTCSATRSLPLTSELTSHSQTKPSTNGGTPVPLTAPKN